MTLEEQIQSKKRWIESYDRTIAHRKQELAEVEELRARTQSALEELEGRLRATTLSQEAPTV